MYKNILKPIKHKHYGYCPKCRKRQPHLKSPGYKMCKVCGYQEKAEAY